MQWRALKHPSDQLESMFGHTLLKIKNNLKSSNDFDSYFEPETFKTAVVYKNSPLVYSLDVTATVESLEQVGWLDPDLSRVKAAKKTKKVLDSMSFACPVD
jgi:hypothetical protein